jgi:hypothetical protein
MLNEVFAQAETDILAQIPLPPPQIYILLSQKNSYPGLLKNTTLF